MVFSPRKQYPKGWLRRITDKTFYEHAGNNTNDAHRIPGLFLNRKQPLPSRSPVPNFPTIGFMAIYTIIPFPKWARNSFI